MILTMTKDKVISIENNQIQWNCYELFHKEIFNNNFYKNPSNHFVMGHTTFRNFRCVWPGFYYVFTSCLKPHMNLEIPNVKFITSISEVPSSDLINTWFIGGKSIYECFGECMDEIVTIQLCIDTNELFKNLELKKTTFVLPDNFVLVNKYSEYIYENGLGKSILKKTLKYKNNKKNIENNKNKQDENNVIFAIDPQFQNIKYLLSKTIEINLMEGFPFFDSFNLEYIFNEMWNFLNGSCDSYLFCNHFGLQCIPKTTEAIDNMTLIQTNRNNIHLAFINQINSLCNYFHVPINNLYLTVYKPLLLEYDTARAFEIQLLCIQGEIHLLYYLPQMNEIIDKPFVVMGLAFLLFSIVHFLNENRACPVPVCYKPGTIKIMIGKLFYYIEQETFSRNHRMIPIYMSSFKKNLLDYSIQTDFVLKW